MFRNRKLIAIFVIVYALIVFSYPLVADESAFSIIGKSMDKSKLYQDVPDNKPPAIFVLTFLISKIPLNTVLLTRFFVLVLNLATAYFATKLSLLLFNPKKEHLVFIPVLYLLSSILYLGGVSLLTETVESFFVILSLVLFFECRRSSYQNITYFLFSVLFLFFAFQCKQTAILFIFIPAVILFFEKKFNLLTLFCSVFVSLFLLLTIILYFYGIFDDYLEYVWFSNFSERGNRIYELLDTHELLRKALLSIFILPIILPSLLGMYTEFKNSRILAFPIITSVLIILIITLVIAQVPAYRYYLLEISALLLLFLPSSFAKNHSRLVFSKFQPAIFYSVLFILSIFCLFIFIKTLGFFGGYSLLNNLDDIHSIDNYLLSLSCKDVISDSVYYWHAHGAYSANIVYSLGWWNNNHFDKDIFISKLSDGACFVDYFPYSFYSFGSEQQPQKHKELEIAEQICVCKSFDLTSAYSTICYDCSK